MLKPRSYRAFLLINSSIIGSLKRLATPEPYEPHPLIYGS